MRMPVDTLCRRPQTKVTRLMFQLPRRRSPADAGADGPTDQRSQGSRIGRALLVGASAALLSCTHPTAPDLFLDPPEGTYQSTLFGVIGPGAGGVSLTPQAIPEGYFDTIIRVRVRAKTNTTYLVQRAADVDRQLNDDGVCQRAEGLPPWTGATPLWVTFPLPVATDLKTITTNAAGEGSIDFEYRSPTLPRGYRFDVRMRLIDSETSPTSELHSACMTIEVK